MNNTAKLIKTLSKETQANIYDTRTEGNTITFYMDGKMAADKLVSETQGKRVSKFVVEVIVQSSTTDYDSLVETITGNKAVVTTLDGDVKTLKMNTNGLGEYVTVNGDKEYFECNDLERFTTYYC